jgi:hypothetical protein
MSSMRLRMIALFYGVLVVSGVSRGQSGRSVNGSLPTKEGCDVKS